MISAVCFLHLFFLFVHKLTGESHPVLKKRLSLQVRPIRWSILFSWGISIKIRRFIFGQGKYIIIYFRHSRGL